MEADPRKPPLKVLSEALCDPWVDATWRLKVALGRSYRRWTSTAGGAPDAANGETALTGAGTSGVSSGAAAGSSTRRGASSIALPIHTIPMASLGHNGIAVNLLARGQSAPNVTGAAAAAPKALSPGLATGTAVPAVSEEFSSPAAAAAAASRSRGASLQQRSGTAAAATAAAAAAALADRPGPGASSHTTVPAAASTMGLSGVCTVSPSPCPGLARLQYKAGHEGDHGRGLSLTGGHGSTTTACDNRGHEASAGEAGGERARLLRAGGLVSSRWANGGGDRTEESEESLDVKSDGDAAAGGSGGMRHRLSGPV
ncbi:hypothetical protein Vretifemale_21038 [Volvox reticuliferus]|nr:hypothetical protein Vretifemale_21038 [Volvox reticuliferus]